MSVRIILSTKRDGSMLIHEDKSDPTVIKNREKFLTSFDLDPARTTRVNVVYTGDDYCRYHTLTKNDIGKGMYADDSEAFDGLVVTQKNTPVLLALADCVGAIIYDPEHDICMVSHLGRHSIEQDGGRKSIEYLMKNHDSNPSHLLVTLSPSAGRINYPLTSFSGRAMQDVVCDQLSSAGVFLEHIQTSAIDTTTSPDFYSHSEFLKNNREVDGRFAIVATICD